ncbi:MAG TPA: beta-galactosidase trimerization domain-containing protein [Microbacterium sp.]|uniref:beta-galactosidase trimerization domain-containing protein n=1 Tax=Microbacterium sp. TaxID=51671 RepID=UPI002B466E35|nr:beta-galactosidase trimerization domain-containing protein [Microbacterium sp.]HKT57106.1 beta-galactosidase trimerization domain-containing protein [Microbacterium sp.]
MTAPEQPLLGLWFGNFFEPFYSDEAATRAGVADAASLGFTSLNLDSKPWEDFFARYRGEPASRYVSMQELMMTEAAAHGLDVTCLALYLCGDNLYPTIRDVPPVRGEDAIRPDGSSMGTYKYWSPRAQSTMVEHVRGLLRLYGDRMHRRGDGRIVMQTMFEPIPKPSFDAEGRAHYLGWLERRHGTIEVVNRRYGTDAAGFADLAPDDYWLRPAELSWVGCAIPSADDVARRSPDFHRWIDNQTYLADVLDDYLATMARRWRALDPAIFAEPVLHQWGYFFNPPGKTDWQTGQRALDVYRAAEHLDGALFIASPLNAENRPDASALSVEASILRTANGHRRFTGGLYLGRHVNVDVYDVVPPAEAIGTYVAAGADALHTYGYSGLDDGGVLFRADDVFRDSLTTGLDWAKRVIPLLRAPRTKEAAILFPAEMSLYEPVSVDDGGRHRMDLLGWYRQLTDLGWHVDILHPDQAASGALTGYSILVVPTNSLYDLVDHRDLEDAVHTFVAGGGTLLHGPDCGLAQHAFGVSQTATEFDCLDWQEPVIPHGWTTVAYASGEALATYLGSGERAMTRTAIGSGAVYSIGFEYGYAYARQTMPIVPPQYGRREMHPLPLLRETPVAAFLGVAPSAVTTVAKGVEFARFGDRLVVVNHRASPVSLPELAELPVIAQLDAAPGVVAGHSAACFHLRPS